MKTIVTFLAMAMVAIPTLCVAQNTNKGLNQIRFENWTEDDWQDNDYYREIRKYITNFQKGKVRDSVLSANKDVLDSKFIVLEAQPFLGGGLWVCISFLDSPNDMFRVWIYSFVDEQKEEVCGYEVRSFELLDKQTGCTEMDYHRLMAENSKIKLW